MTLMNRPPYSLLLKALTFITRRRPADAAVFLSTRSCSAAPGAPQSSLMAEYLVRSCGFDPDKAAKACKLLGRIESRHQPDSVLGFFKSYGCSDEKGHIFKPPVASPRRGEESGPKAVIRCTLENVLSKIQFWQGILGSNDSLVKLCKGNRWFLEYSIEKRIQPNIEFLRDCGITDQKKLSMVLRRSPLIICRKAETLKALIGRVEGLGVARTSGMFHLIVMVLHSVSEKNFKAHSEFFKGIGWSEDDFHAACRKDPTIVKCSLKEFAEKTLIPRFRVLTGLESRGVHVDSRACYIQRRNFSRQVHQQPPQGVSRTRLIV
ncbi:hypothetical protein GW17_00009329 [Ensete ventricosum]|nr:hypothetical protein GW17_00009329 [Ensete ventricosum]